ncbi:hypothetical protein A3B85_02285 [Candidatus Nomurabacteria bacterium RIFCSPHIGHO2_02_FULL_37_13]|uniref:Exosortase/archaeosortase family protein n=1 Tax=Candidatus Nomurabacteria bacterium RIFCSPHIGHO2_02_FULL_37_13 TaxID=1801750 RepID=A0A1F6W6N7_9BACT|nr:MAG: hypothetical protein A3B85_02285 [Candidatus Nomurabacteria bacterium RIFCSPHIGHO2_02_FULL_37_13]
MTYSLIRSDSPEIRLNSREQSSNKFSVLFMIAALLLMIMPFISTFNEFLTSLFLKWKLYRALEEFIVPYQARALAGLFSLFPVSVFATSKGVWLSGIFLELQWNCLGWQSAVLLLASFLTGFQGKFSKISRFEVILIGVLGTYLINFLRLFIVGFFAVFVGSRAVGIFHDWFSLNFVLIWFFVFWWFSYSFVLETKDAD